MDEFSPEYDYFRIIFFKHPSTHAIRPRIRPRFFMYFQTVQQFEDPFWDNDIFTNEMNGLVPVEGISILESDSHVKAG